MDMTETYVKMRLAAIPYLGMGIPPEITDGDEIMRFSSYVDRVGNFYHVDVDISEGQTLICQLERQDQLQDMLGYSIRTLLAEFNRWLKNALPIHNKAILQLNITMGQLWLAFIMKELHNKTWGGNRWV